MGTFLGIVAFSIVVATNTAIGAGCGKALSILSGISLCACIALYLVLGCTGLIYSAVATFRFPLELFMALSECMQLSVNSLNGLLIWEDWKVIHGDQHTITYSSIYVLIGLGVYLCTSFDVLG